jgi:hypothetical protein
VQDRDALEALDAGKVRWPTLREGVYYRPDEVVTDQLGG